MCYDISWFLAAAPFSIISCGWRGLQPEQRTGRKVKPEISAPARPNDYLVCGMTQHPSNHIYYSLSFSAASASEDGLSITPGGPPESRASLCPTTQDTGRRLPVVSTAPPVNVPNHHPLYRNPPQHQAPLGPHGQPNYFEDSGGSSSHPSSQPTFSTPHPSSQPTYSTPLSGTPLDNGDKRASDESAESSNMQTALIMHALADTSHFDTPVPVTSADPEHAAIIPSAATSAREKDEVRPDQLGLRQNVKPGSDEEETTTTTITTTTIITTMQSPGKNTCHIFLMMI